VLVDIFSVIVFPYVVVSQLASLPVGSLARR
jgi:hypothetical protein